MAMQNNFKNAEYELLDSGGGEKLERFGQYILRRSDPQALWAKKLPNENWEKAHATFDKSWVGRKNLPVSWEVSIHELKFLLKLSTFKHVGVFPEQVENWKWAESLIKGEKRKIKVLNLFGYTGGATLSALRAGAEVVHVDGSKVAISWARENAEISGLSNGAVRWILDDVKKFVKREEKRANKYDAIIMDPPAFGRGPDGEVWKIEEDFSSLVRACSNLLSSKPLFFLINGYAAGYSHIAYLQCLRGELAKYGGKFESGELFIRETGDNRLLPAGIFARWQR